MKVLSFRTHPGRTRSAGFSPLQRLHDQPSANTRQFTDPKRHECRAPSRQLDWNRKGTSPCI